ncbi:AfsR/SARP family transcriptional regulator [Streptomyces litchfieldiae]|uniref:AfsR/SARP family transcriptional regulator n=1 Tax=Streptomyces litchfieldiae TaxID=3075543 RepID=A0ABU2MPA0_9ACTN|nr:AfsR/SARP family transcriptional regulator [Streptomyces sp. DSM 44938]MDT0343461.1 AfsR/SARP family transcriptional regulator [Streptomyces sp. DSM 44938]
MRFGVLGPLEVTATGHGGALATPQAPKIRVVLGTLLIRANAIVSVDTLIDELWSDDPPRTAPTTLQVYVSQLRKMLHAADPEAGRAALATRRPGYVLRLGPGQLDLTEFEELHARGGAAMQNRDYAAAADLQRRALALWRGPLLSDTPHGALLESAEVRLAELRVTALERRIRAELCLGMHRDLVGELQELATNFPMREEIHAHLMVALYRTGRQADALRAFARIRDTLAEELDIEPGRHLTQLHRRIRAGDATLLHGTGRAAATPALGRPPAELPAPDPAFTGRAGELARLVDKLLTAARDGGPVVVTGMAGVGKTALALAAARRTEALFPDGQLLVRLRSPAGEPLGPAEAVDQLLRQAGIRSPGAGGAAERLGLLRGLWQGRRMLLVLDNACSEAQIRALLPTAPGCVALITCRRPLAGLADARPLALDVPGPGDAAGLFTAAGGAPAGERAVAEIAELCGRLPLALRALAARRADPAELAARLRPEDGRLRELGEGRGSVGAVLVAAYREVPPADRRAFRLLGLLPPGPFGPDRAAAVLGVRPPAAGAAAESLVAAGLLARAEPAPDRSARYQLHPLLRLVAAERLTAEEPPEAVTEAVARLCAESAAPPEADPLEWFARDRAALVALVTRAHATGLWRETVTLADALTPALETLAAWEDWEHTHTLALDAAGRLDDDAARARMLRSLGDLAWQRRRLRQAQDFYERARLTADAAGDRAELARALAGLADLRLDAGAPADAAGLLARVPAEAEAGAERARSRFETSRAQGLLALETGRAEAAERYFGDCLELAAELRDPRLMAYARAALGSAGEAGEDPPEWVEVRPGVWRVRTVA